MGITSMVVMVGTTMDMGATGGMGDMAVTVIEVMTDTKAQINYSGGKG